jgi:hypothetical protein
MFLVAALHCKAVRDPMALRKYCTLRTLSPDEPSCCCGQFMRLHSAIADITPADRLASRHLKIFAERNRKPELARGKAKRRSLTESIIASSSYSPLRPFRFVIWRRILLIRGRQGDARVKYLAEVYWVETRGSTHVGNHVRGKSAPHPGSSVQDVLFSKA